MLLLCAACVTVVIWAVPPATATSLSYFSEEGFLQVPPHVHCCCQEIWQNAMQQQLRVSHQVDVTSAAGHQHVGLLLLALCSRKHLESLASEEPTELLLELLVPSWCLQANSELSMALHIHHLSHKQHVTCR